jgi:hypothetical protein
LVSGITGFGSFLAYLGYGYLDSWHAVATVALFPCFIGGLWLTRRCVLAKATRVGTDTSWRSLLHCSGQTSWRSRTGVGRACLLLAATGMIGAGLTILSIGTTEVFVPTDLTYMGMTRDQFDSINPRLIPLIAHDRAGFGGGVGGAASRSLWQGMLIGGLAGWGAGIGIHPIIGYNDSGHLAPAVAGAGLFFTGLALTRSSMMNGESHGNNQPDPRSV